MNPLDQSAEYYRLREGHERALALAARSREERDEHLLIAARYAALAGDPKADFGTSSASNSRPAR